MGKQVKTPRFYVDIPTFLHATGQLGWDSTPRGGAELLYMNCANPFLQIDGSTTVFRIGHDNNNPPKTSFPINFCALLNHNLASDSNNFKVSSRKGFSNSQEQGPKLNNSSEVDGIENVLNTFCSSDGVGSEFNGSSIWTFSDSSGIDEFWTNFDVYFSGGINSYTHQLGSFVVGKYWDAPNSPDLNLTMSRRFDGIKKQKTIGGKTLANIYYDGPTEWTMNHPDDGTYKYPPFELDYPLDDFASEIGFNARAKSGLGRKGLRSWKLSFSYIAESDMWMENEVSNTLISDDTDFSNTDANPMLSDNSFNFVWNCTLGGTLPFIFQPDNSEDGRNPDQFAICNFRENTLSVQQVAFNTYSLSITIDEVA